ncbi:STAS domain-containing protein [Geodermatophilus sp. SYSU D00697]
MASTGHPDGHAGGQRGGGEPAGTTAVEGSSFTETVDPRTGSIRASGRLDTRAADMLSGTIAGLRRGGCTSVLLDLGGVQAVDDAGLHAVRSLEAEVADAGGRMTLLNWPGGRTQ